MRPLLLDDNYVLTNAAYELSLQSSIASIVLSLNVP